MGFFSVLRKRNRLKGDTKTTAGERNQGYCQGGYKENKIRQE